ncbi:MAG: hypothetical protein HS115_14035 [Spirochaetales bacterium]|nr:hypothetical protein [Spirochaetales bacterium]
MSFFNKIAITFIVLFLASCSKRGQDPFLPPAPGLLGFGKDIPTALSTWENAGFILLERTPELLRLRLPETDESKAQGMVPQVPPYVLTGYFNQNKLAIVRIVRRESIERIDAFQKATISLHGLKEIWSGKVDENQKDGFWMLSEEAGIYENSDLWARIRRARYQAQEIGPVNHELEVEFFSKTDNPGLDASQLRP